MFKQIILPLLAVSAFIVVVGLLVQGKIDLPIPKNTNSPKATNAKYITVNNTKVYIEIAKTDSERQKGLGGRKSLDKNSGMLFVFNKGSRPTFWMKDTLIPIDIIWIKNGQIVGINKNIPTEIDKSDAKLTRYPAPDLIDYVLEVNAGFSDNNNLKVGQSLSGLEQL